MSGSLAADLDPSICAILDGLDLRVQSFHTYGTSAWSMTARVDTDKKPFFVKFAKGTNGQQQLEGEYCAMSQIYATDASIAPKPIAWGKCTNSPNDAEYFFQCEFVDITNQLPNPQQIGQRIADLHRNSQGQSKYFGFHRPTYDGKLPQCVDWDAEWPSFFSKLLNGVADLDSNANGKWQQLEEVLSKTYQEVIPKLLGKLRIEPCLIHGDLWEGNIGTDVKTGNLYIFDSCAYYAHHEMEIGMWRVDHHKMKAKAFKREYLRNTDISEPIDEFDDRNRLYSIKTKLMYSAHVPGSNVRKQVFENLCFLVEKCCSDGFEIPEKALEGVEND